MSLRSLLQDRMAALNGRTVEYVLKQDKQAFVRLIGLSVAQVPILRQELACFSLVRKSCCHRTVAARKCEAGIWVG